MEATDEQQTAIPPITSVETTAGALSGSSVKTVYATPTPNNTRINRVAFEDWIALGDTDATTTPSDSFDFSEPPIVLLDEPVLVVGSTTNGAISGNETNPINGGVLLDPSASNTAEGEARLAGELSLTYTITERACAVLGRSIAGILQDSPAASLSSIRFVIQITTAAQYSVIWITKDQRARNTTRMWKLRKK